MSGPTQQTQPPEPTPVSCPAPPLERRSVRSPGWDALLLAILVLALLQITGLAEAGVLPTRIADVLRHPLLGNLLPAAGEAALGDVGPRPGDPIGLLLFASTLALLLGYFVADLAASGKWGLRLKWLLLSGIILTALVLPTAKLILLRQQSGPASYTHDGGVIQTEAAIGYFVEGKNPYVEDYTATPMAEWGFSRYRTALYHYPYLPWTFVFSTPFYLAGQALGGYDQRWVYLLLMLVALALAPRLAQSSRAKPALVATLALNPIMALDIIFGQNDSFVLSWLIFSLVSWQAWQARPERRRWALWLSAALLWPRLRRQADGLVLCAVLCPAAGARQAAVPRGDVGEPGAGHPRHAAPRLARAVGVGAAAGAICLARRLCTIR